MGKRTGVQVVRTVDDVRVMMYMAYGTEECTVCHRHLEIGEAYTKGIGPQGHNQAPYCSLCMPFVAEHVYSIGEKQMSENSPKPLVYIKHASPGLTAIQDLTNKTFAEHNVTTSLQLAYFNDDYVPESEHNSASHVVSMIIDPNTGV